MLRLRGRRFQIYRFSLVFRHPIGKNNIMKNIIRRTNLLIPLIAGLLVSGCLCSEKPSTDVERLKKRIDVTSVHLYAAAKLALSSNDDPALVKARDTVLKLLAEGGVSNLKTTLGQLSMGDMLRIGKAVLALKGAGKEVVQGTRPEGEPLIRLLLQVLGVAPNITQLVDNNTDHAMLFLAGAILKTDERSPVPLPSEVVLYEGWRTDPKALKIPGLDGVVYAFRSLIYGNNDFCDLSAADARAAVESADRIEPLIQGIALLTEGRLKPDGKSIRYFPNGIRALGNGGTALCHYKRGDDKAARPWLKGLIDEVRTTGLGSAESAAYLEVVYLCGGDDGEVAAGKAALAKLPPSSDPVVATDRQLLKAYCDASAETRSELARKISLSAKVARIALEATRNAQVVEGLEASRIYRGTMGVAAMCEQAAAASGKVTGAVDALKGFLNKPKSE